MSEQTRVAIAKRPEPQPPHCPVCDQDVVGWIASPNAAVIDLNGASYLRS